MQSTSPVAPCPVADVICRTLELGIHITGARITDDDITIIEATPREVLRKRMGSFDGHANNVCAMVVESLVVRRVSLVENKLDRLRFPQFVIPDVKAVVAG